jgi:hypothetical protein
MHMLVTRMLQGAALVLVMVLGRVLKFLWRCWSAKRRFNASTIPGPPLASAVVGERCRSCRAAAFEQHTCRTAPLTPNPMPHTAGHIPDLLGPKGIWSLVEWARTYGPVYKLQMLDGFAVVVTDPEAIARITKRTGVWL